MEWDVSLSFKRDWQVDQAATRRASANLTRISRAHARSYNRGDKKCAPLLFLISLIELVAALPTALFLCRVRSTSL